MGYPLTNSYCELPDDWWLSAAAVWDQYSFTSSLNKDPSVFISFIGLSYSTNFPERKRNSLSYEIAYLFMMMNNTFHVSFHVIDIIGSLMKGRILIKQKNEEYR